MPKKNSPSTDPADREIISTRVFHRPRESLWQAFAQPSRLAQWWGPKGFTSTFHTFDFRPGGHWRFAMQGPNGATYENECVFREVIAPERIVFQHVEPIHRFQMTISFTTEDGGTRVTWQMLFDSATESAKVNGFIIPANEENFDRLQAHLAATP